MNIGDIGALLTALGVGSFIVQYLLGGQQRREVRSRVLGAIEEVEDARWANDDATFQKFRKTTHHLETAALVARLPRQVVSDYIFIAWVAWRVSNESWLEWAEGDGTGSLPGSLADITTEAASDVARCAWSPWIARPRVWLRARGRRVRLKVMDDERIERAIEGTRSYMRTSF